MQRYASKIDEMSGSVICCDRGLVVSDGENIIFFQLVSLSSREGESKYGSSVALPWSRISEDLHATDDVVNLNPIQSWIPFTRLTNTTTSYKELHPSRNSSIPRCCQPRRNIIFLLLRVVVVSKSYSNIRLYR